jgi:hypothetical protein
MFVKYSSEDHVEVDDPKLNYGNSPSLLTRVFDSLTLKSSPSEKEELKFIVREIVYCYQIPEPITSDNLEKLSLFLDVSYYSSYSETNLKSVTSFCISLQPRAPSVNIGTLSLHPQCGQTSFIDVLKHSDSTASTKNSTCFLRTHQIQLADDKKVNNTFGLMDTSGYYFLVDTMKCTLTPHDQNVLNRFLNGLPEGSQFGKIEEFNNIPDNTANKTTHLIFIFNARELYEPLSLEKRTISAAIEGESHKYWWPFSFLSTSNASTKEIQISSILQKQPLAEMLSLIKGAAGQLKILLGLEEDDDSIREKFAVIMTHCDMIPNDRFVEFKKEIKKECKFAGISENRIYFGFKECQWDEQVLQQYDKEKQHVPSSACKLGTNCKHGFTKDTIETYTSVIKMFLHTSK